MKPRLESPRAGEPALLSVTPTQDGLWCVNERGPGRVAVAYFPSKLGALKHAVKAARARPRARVALLHDDGEVAASRSYDDPSPPAEVP
jgi:hypothetical protein